MSKLGDADIRSLIEDLSFLANSEDTFTKIGEWRSNCMHSPSDLLDLVDVGEIDALLQVAENMAEIVPILLEGWKAHAERVASESSFEVAVSPAIVMRRCPHCNDFLSYCLCAKTRPDALPAEPIKGT